MHCTVVVGILTNPSFPSLLQRNFESHIEITPENVLRNIYSFAVFLKITNTAHLLNTPATEM